VERLSPHVTFPLGVSILAPTVLDWKAIVSIAYLVGPCGDLSMAKTIQNPAVIVESNKTVMPTDYEPHTLRIF